MWPTVWGRMSMTHRCVFSTWGLSIGKPSPWAGPLIGRARSVGGASTWAGPLCGRGLTLDLAPAPEQRACSSAGSHRAALSAVSAARGQSGTHLVEVPTKVGPLLRLLHLRHLARSSERSPGSPLQKRAEVLSFAFSPARPAGTKPGSGRHRWT